MTDSETPQGLRILYDLLVKTAEYPGESPHNPRNLYSFGEKLKALHHMISGYHDGEYENEFRAIMQKIGEVSKDYPSAKYVSEGYETLFEWLGSISRLYSRLGLMIPQNLTYTEGGDEGI
jgi:hypothetical protein